MRNVKSQAAGSRRCRCCYVTQGIHELKLWRKHALKPELTPAGFPKQLQKCLVGSYEHQLMSVNTMIHRWGTRALSKKASFVAAHSFNLFSPSFAPLLPISSALTLSLIISLPATLPSSFFSSYLVSSDFPHPPRESPGHCHLLCLGLLCSQEAWGSGEWVVLPLNIRLLLFDFSSKSGGRSGLTNVCLGYFQAPCLCDCLIASGS